MKDKKIMKGLAAAALASLFTVGTAGISVDTAQASVTDSAVQISKEKKCGSSCGSNCSKTDEKKIN